MVTFMIIKVKFCLPWVRCLYPMTAQGINTLDVLNLSKTLYEGAAYMSKRVLK